MLQIPVMALPGKAGHVAPPKVVVNPNTKGKDLTEMVAGHHEGVGTDQVARHRPWSSIVCHPVTDSLNRPAPPYEARDVFPSFRPIRMREVDERDPALGAGRRPKRARVMDSNMKISVLDPGANPPSAPARKPIVWTQDLVEEDDDYRDNCFFNQD